MYETPRSIIAYFLLFTGIFITALVLGNVVERYFDPADQPPSGTTICTCYCPPAQNADAAIRR